MRSRHTPCSCCSLSPPTKLIICTEMMPRPLSKEWTSLRFIDFQIHGTSCSFNMAYTDDTFLTTYHSYQLMVLLPSGLRLYWFQWQSCTLVGDVFTGGALSWSSWMLWGYLSHYLSLLPTYGSHPLGVETVLVSEVLLHSCGHYQMMSLLEVPCHGVRGLFVDSFSLLSLLPFYGSPPLGVETVLVSMAILLFCGLNMDDVYTGFALSLPCRGSSRIDLWIVFSLFLFSISCFSFLSLVFSFTGFKWWLY